MDGVEPRETGAQAEEPVAGDGADGEAQGSRTEGAIAEGESVDLTQFDEFRKFQQKYDRKLSQRDKEIQELRSQLDEFKLSDMEPEEKAEYYKQQREQLLQQQQQQQQQDQLVQDVLATLESAGINPDDPDLDWGNGEVNQENANRVLASALKIASSRDDEQAEETVREAKREALDEAGVTQVAPSGDSPSPDNPIENVNDPDELLSMAFGSGEGSGQARG